MKVSTKKAIALCKVIGYGQASKKHEWPEIRQVWVSALDLKKQDSKVI